MAKEKSMDLNPIQFLFNTNFLSKSNVLSTTEMELFKSSQLESIIHSINFYQVIKNECLISVLWSG